MSWAKGGRMFQEIGRRKKGVEEKSLEIEEGRKKKGRRRGGYIFMSRLPGLKLGHTLLYNYEVYL